MLNDNGILFLITSKRAEKQGWRNCELAKTFFEDNNIPYVAKFVEDLTREEISYLIDIIDLDCFDKPLWETVFASVNPNTYHYHHAFRRYVLDNRIDLTRVCQDKKQIKALMYLFKRLLNLPIAIKDRIAVAGYNYEDYQQFLIEDRDNIKWLVDEPLVTDEEKINFIIKNFAKPKRVTQGKTILYFPKTSALYGGSINWIYPKGVIDNDVVVKKIKCIPITMQISLGNAYKEYSYKLDVIPL